MTTITRPMLADTIENVEDLKYPLLVSPKLDGIRCVVVGGKALTRKFKPIPNTYIRNWIEANLPDGFDGELITGTWLDDEQFDHDEFNTIQSKVMSEDGEPDFQFHAFDYVVSDLKRPFEERFTDLCMWVLQNLHGKPELDKFVRVVSHNRVSGPAELSYFEAIFLKHGYEGLMVRSLNGEYKCGRSTLKQGWLLKLKRFADSEAEILGFEELQSNTNEQEVNELGLAKRSKKKAGMVGAGMLGKFKVRDIHTGAEFDIGTGDGLTQELRREIWLNKANYLGKLVKYKYQPAGQKDLPRFPVWLGFRHKDDL